MEQFKKAKIVMLPTNQKAKEGMIYLKPKIGIFNKTSSENHNNNVYNCNPQHLYIISDDEITNKDLLNTNDYYYIRNHYNEWYVGKYNGVSFDFINNDGNFDSNLFVCKKIIATTDSSLKIETILSTQERKLKSLPQPSKQFIEKFVEEYNRENIITDVSVEYETLYDIELLVDTQDFKKGSYIRGRCSSKKDFSKAKRRFFELHTDSNHYNIARDTNKVNILYKTYFKDVEFTNVKISPKDNTITIKKVKETYTKKELCQILEKYTSFLWSEVGIHYPISLGNSAREKFINREL